MIISFYCDKCELDQDLPTIKSSNRYGLNLATNTLYESENYKEWYKARCRKCNKPLIRYITDPDKDPYFAKSKKIRKQRNALKKDLLQYGDDGFKTAYPKQYAMMEKRKEMLYNKKIRKKKEKDEFYNKHKHDVVARNIAKKVIEAEEKLENVN